MPSALATGSHSSLANPAVSCEAVPIACRIARALFGVGGSYVPQAIPSLLVSGLDDAPKALSGDARGLTVTDDAYDTTSYVSSTIFEVPQVASSTSTRSGASEYLYGNGRLAQMGTSGASSLFLEDGRGSTVQEAYGAGSVSAWRSFTAFGGIAAGSDAREKGFFGYNGESQSPVTGLVYMHARYYEPSSGRFGVADTWLGQASEPLTMNRYLYCSADPLNYIDPTGQVKARILPESFFDKNAKDGRASMPTAMRDFNQQEVSVKLTKNSSLAKALAPLNTLRWKIQRSNYIAGKYGKETAKYFRAAVARGYQLELAKIYCGTASYMQNGVYDREAAIRYAYLYSHVSGGNNLEDEFWHAIENFGFRNPLYPSYKGNCANFVSQVLHEGGYPMTQDWHATRNYAALLGTAVLGIVAGAVLYDYARKERQNWYWDTTHSWTLAAEQFAFMSNPANGFTSKQVIDVYKGTSSSGKGETNVAYSDLASSLPSLGVQPGDIMYFYNKEEGVHHATVISSVENGKIKYSGNSVNRFDYSLGNGLKDNDGVLIVRINDEF